MSQQERDKLDWLKRAKDGSMTQREVANRMGVSDRWVRSLLKRMKKRGDAVVVHGLRGREWNRKIAAKLQARAMEILKQPDWHDFGPTLASEQLVKHHQLDVSKETLRAWMIEAGLWKPGARRIEQVHCWRPRRSAFGELLSASGGGAVEYATCCQHYDGVSRGCDRADPGKRSGAVARTKERRRERTC